MITKTNVSVVVNGETLDIRILNNGRGASFHLELTPDISTPLAVVNTVEGHSYCYFATGEGISYEETRVYSCGGIITR